MAKSLAYGDVKMDMIERARKGTPREGDEYFLGPLLFDYHEGPNTIVHFRHGSVLRWGRLVDVKMVDDERYAVVYMQSMGTVMQVAESEIEEIDYGC